MSSVPGEQIIDGTVRPDKLRASNTGTTGQVPKLHADGKQVTWSDDDDSGVTDHGALTGLTDDDHTQYALLAGRASGQILEGGTASGETLTLKSTDHATKGGVIIGDDDWLELDGITAPSTPASGDSRIYVDSTTDRATEITSDGEAMPLGPVSADRHVRIFRPMLSGHNRTSTTDNMAYWCYVGRVRQDVTIDYVEFLVMTAGAGSQTAEVGLFSTPSAPNKAGQTMTKIVATGTVDSLTVGGVKRNTSAFSQAVARGTHLWCGLRINMATTQPQVAMLTGDLSEGAILILSAAAVFTSVSTQAGVIKTDNGAGLAPRLHATMD